MSPSLNRVLLWSPRILGILLSLFIGLFALDAFGQGRPLLATIGAFVVHAIPALVLMALVAVSWRRPWMGAIAFTILAIAYALSAGMEHVSWILTISGPLMVVGALFLVSWRRQGISHAS